MKGHTIRRISRWSRWLSYLFIATAGLSAGQFFVSGMNPIWLLPAVASIVLSIVCTVIEFKMHNRWVRGW